MYTGMLGAAAFMNWKGELKTAAGIAWFAAGGIIGWPFAMALCAPFLLEEGLFAVMSLGDTDRFLDILRRAVKGIFLAVAILVSADLDTIASTRADCISLSTLR